MKTILRSDDHWASITVRVAVLAVSRMALLVSAVVSAMAVGARLEGVEGVEGVEAGVVVLVVVTASFLPEEAAAMAPTPTATAPTAHSRGRSLFTSDNRLCNHGE